MGMGGGGLLALYCVSCCTAVRFLAPLLVVTRYCLGCFVGDAAIVAARCVSGASLRSGVLTTSRRLPALIWVVLTPNERGVRA
jgi:hypothetical protein